MKLRIAQKIIKAVGTPDARRYSEFQIGKAAQRFDRMRSAKEDRRYWPYLVGMYHEHILSTSEPLQ